MFAVAAPIVPNSFFADVFDLTPGRVGAILKALAAESGLGLDCDDWPRRKAWASERARELNARPGRPPR